MVTAPFANFFATSAQAGAALVGLLFVAVQLAPEKMVTREAAPERRVMARGTFTALANAFFVSMFALVPDQNLGYALILVGLGAVVSTIYELPVALRQHAKLSGLANRRVPIAAAALAYALEFWQGVVLLENAPNSDALYTVAFILIGVYVLGLWRAWQLIDGQWELFPRIGKHSGASPDNASIRDRPPETTGG